MFADNSKPQPVDDLLDTLGTRRLRGWSPPSEADLARLATALGGEHRPAGTLFRRCDNVSAASIRQSQAWSDYEYGRAKRQSWNGPSIVGPLLERVMFESGDSPDFEAFVAELVRIRAATTGHE